MIHLTLQLRYTDRPQRPPAAWFVHGSDPQSWLDEIVRWQLPTTHVRIHVLPTSSSDRTPCGALISAAETPRVTPHAHAYGTIGRQFYLPVEARLEPDVSENELANLLPNSERRYVWHPTAGLVGFDPSEALLVTALVAAPRERGSRWDRAVPGIALAPRLLSVEPDEPPLAAAMLDALRDEFGPESPDLKDLPPTPDEPKQSPLAGLKQKALAPIASAIQGLAKLAPGAAAAAGALGGLQAWAAQVLSGPLREARERELRRLMHLLKSDPDEGLKFALPFGGSPHRGIAPPSSQLGAHDVGFDLSRLGSGGPADFWDVPPDMQLELRARYRELANREMRLGRHRRAAYIFAELLDDLSSAAAALAAGGHHREAAVLYRDRLNRPWDAARCLDEGGLWSEAVRLYEQLGADEQAGDLYLKMQQPVEAAIAYLNAVERAQHRGDFLKASKLMNEKLGAPDRALAILDQGWPHSGQAGSCLDESFRLLGQLGRHQAATAKIEVLRRKERTHQTSFLLVDRLAGTAASYPDQSVRAAAADAARVVVGEELHGSTAANTRSLLLALERLAPHDRLHKRDCDRFLHGVRERERVRQTRAIPSGTPEPRLVFECKAPLRAEWWAAASAQDAFYLVGFKDQSLVVQRGFWKSGPGWLDVVDWRSPALPHGPVLLGPDPAGLHPLLIGVCGGTPLPERLFPATDNAAVLQRAVTPPWLPPEAIGLARGPGGIAWGASAAHGTLELFAYDSEDCPIASHMIPLPQPELEEPHLPAVPLPMHVRPEGVCIGFGSQLIAAIGQGISIRDLHRPIRGLCGSGPFSRLRLAVAFDRGAAVIWDTPTGPHQNCASDLEDPLICTTAGGHLVVVSESACEVYSTTAGRLTLHAALSDVRLDPLAVVPTARRDEFAVCRRDGRILVYAIA